MNSSDLYRAFRVDVQDDEIPYLWTDEEVWSYMQDAHRMFFRMIGGIPDFGGDERPWASIEAEFGEPFTRTHPSILRFVSAHTRRGHPVDIVNSTDFVRYFGAGWKLHNRLGHVRCMILGLRPDYVRWVDVPDRTFTVDLEVYRLPLERVTGPDQPLFELEEQHHRYLLHWMKNLAYAKADADAFDATASDRGRALFEQYIAQVKAERARERYKPRAVHYGGL